MRRGLIIGSSVALLMVVLVVLFGGSGDNSNGGDVQALQFEAAEIRTLEAITTLDGTLGFPEGDPIANRIPGTITEVVAAGTVVAEGEALYWIDEEPVFMLQGTTPAFRDLGALPVLSEVGSRTGGTVTSLPEVDDVIPINGELFRVNDEPVVVLPGELPAYRTLRSGVEGVDVQQLEQALADLGYDPNGFMTVDETFTSNTAAAVERWQEDIGMTVDGRVEFGEVYFFPGEVTVTSVTGAVGATATANLLTVLADTEPIDGPDVTQLQESLNRLGYDAPTHGVFNAATEAAVRDWQSDTGAVIDGVVHLGEVVFRAEAVRVIDALLTPGSPATSGANVLATSATSSVVSVDLSGADQDLLEVGMLVQVEMPNGELVDATVTEISGIATRTSTGDVVFETTIEVADSSVASDLDQAPVDVLVVTDSRADVLSVAVTALLALSEGGYAVQVDDGDGQIRLVAVEPGLFADGWVEIAGAVSPGDRVVVP